MAEKRCLYEVLNLPKTCSQDEIRSAYKKLALQLHPDKLIQTGIPENQATAGFQELINAYDVLSDPRERSWYDSHREQILYSTPSNSDFNSTLNLFSFFSNSVFSGYSDSGKGFFKVYGDVFKKLYDQEISFATKLGFDKSVVKEAPLMGNLESGYNQVSAFYNYWLGFVSVMDFTWVDQYHASAGPNRKSRRVMEEENKKLRKKARREYNEMVRGLAEFVKKRDKRVIERQLQKNLEQKEKQEKETARRKEEERVKLENARLYEEADWARVEEDVLDDLEEEEDRKKDGKELYCVVCGKKFKSDKQWKNHEQSKKHKERVAELRDSFVEEEEIVGNQVGCDDESKLCDEFEDAVDCGSESKHDVDDGGDFRSSFSDDNNEESTVASEDGDNGSDEEMAIFEAMIKGHRTRKNVVVDVRDSSSSKAYDAVPDSSSGKADDANADETSFEKSEVSSHRRRRRNREPKKENGAKCDVNGGVDIEDVKADSNGTHERRSSSCDNVDPSKVSSVDGKPCKQETGVVDVGGLLQKKNQKPLNQPIDKKAPGQNEGNSKRKNSSKGKKGKASSKLFDHSCETCDESFDSRNKLFMHLSSTGHAMLKSR